MGAYTLPKIMLMWEHGKLTERQAIGQLIQLVFDAEARVDQIECKLLQHIQTASNTAANGTVSVRRHRAKSNMTR